jgi:hypothetical protein
VVVILRDHAPAARMVSLDVSSCARRHSRNLPGSQPVKYLSWTSTILYTAHYYPGTLLPCHATCAWCHGEPVCDWLHGRMMEMKPNSTRGRVAGNILHPHQGSNTPLPSWAQKEWAVSTGMRALSLDFLRDRLPKRAKSRHVYEDEVAQAYNAQPAWRIQGRNVTFGS